LAGSLTGIIGTQAWFEPHFTRTREWQILPDAPHKRDHAQRRDCRHKLYSSAGRETGA